MKKVKKALLLLLAVCIFSIPLASCAQGGKEQGVSVVTTIFAPYDFARALGGENVNVKMLLSPGADSHTYDPSMQDQLAIKKCDRKSRIRKKI